MGLLIKDKLIDEKILFGSLKPNIREILTQGAIIIESDKQEGYMVINIREQREFLARRLGLNLKLEAKKQVAEVLKNHPELKTLNQTIAFFKGHHLPDESMIMEAIDYFKREQ